MRILLVADPQIQGNLHEGPWGFVRRWDADRYLAKTFSWANSAYSPNLVVFLGDLLDEGSEADEDDYAEYVQRFKSIYGLTPDDLAKCAAAGSGVQAGGLLKDSCQTVFLPGDNDIGGEGIDPVTVPKVKRFNQNFPSKSKYHFESKNVTLDVIPVSALLQHVTAPAAGQDDFAFKDVVPKNKQANEVRIVISHFPVIPMDIG